MAKDFKSAILELWELFGLEPPRFGPRDEMSLSAEGASLRLADSEDGRHMLVAADAGRLSEDPMRRADQIRAVLQNNLAYLSSRRVCVCLAADRGAPPLIEAQAIHDYRSGPGALSALIKDVLFLQERYGAELQDLSGPKQRVSPQHHEHQDVIFQP